MTQSEHGNKRPINPLPPSNPGRSNHTKRKDFFVLFRSLKSNIGLNPLFFFGIMKYTEKIPCVATGGFIHFFFLLLFSQVN